jgi:predicted signal transduction protein with EAL and GGDEF domain
VGDQLLVAVAERLTTVLRPGDTVARFGGDHFTILCEELGSEDDAISVATAVAERMTAPFAVAGRDVHLSVSTGIAVSHGDQLQPDAILRNADSAMARAKALGKARYELFDELLHTRAMGRLELENALHRALEQHEFRVYYQPEIDLATGQMVGSEALVRWHHPERGVVEPTEFIGLAEESNLIDRIGTWVLREACTQMQAWHEHHPGHPPLRVSVNLSARQLADPDVVAIVIEALQASGLPPSQLRLEITESTVMDDAERNVDVLRALKALGLEVAIDDFGTGYSSLSYLKRFPVDALKIDRSFVDGLGRDPEDSAIVSAVVSLGRALGLDTVAEGVETFDQLTALRTLGCRFGQGFVWSEAVPIHFLDAWQGGPHHHSRIPA